MHGRVDMIYAGKAQHEKWVQDSDRVGVRVEAKRVEEGTAVAGRDGNVMTSIGSGIVSTLDHIGSY